MTKELIGVDVGGTTIKIGRFTLDGKCIKKWDIPTNKTENGRFIVDEILDSILHQVDLESIHGIGFGVPGPVINGVVAHCVNLGWPKTYLVNDVLLKLGKSDILIRATNDANAAAAGEAFQGAAKDYENVCMLTLGTGVGGGIVVNGIVINGINGSAGELGHLVVDDKYHFACNCGKKGCLETVASATGIVSLAKAVLHESSEPSLLRQFDTFSAKRVFDIAKSGDNLANQVIEEAASYLAKAMANVALTLNPDVFVLGGGVANAGEFLIKKIEPYYYALVEPFVSETKIMLAKLGNDAGIYGAASLVK